MDERLPRFQPGQVLAARDLNRLVDAVEQGQVVPVQGGKIRVTQTPVGRFIEADVNDTAVVRITGAASGGLYPGRIQRWDGTAWVDGPEVWVRVLG